MNEGHDLLLNIANKKLLNIHSLNKDDLVIDNVNLYVKNGMEVMDAIKRVAKERKIPKNEIYKEYHRR